MNVAYHPRYGEVYSNDPTAAAGRMESILGFVTGQEEEWAEIARRCGATSAEVQARFNSVLTKLSNKTTTR